MSENISWDKKPTEDIAWGVMPSGQQMQPDEQVSWNTPKQPQNSLVEGVTGMLPSAMLGVAKPFYGLNQAAWQLAGKVAPSVANYGDWPVEMLNKRQAQLNAQAGPMMSKFTTEPAALIGENLGPMTLANKANTAMNAGATSLKQIFGNNALIGAATAYMNPEKTGLSQADFAKEKAKSVALGVAIPSVLTAAGGAIKNTLAPTVTSAAQKLMDLGVELTPGQKLGGALKNLEDKATSLPFVGGMINNARTAGIESFDKAAFKKVLDPIKGKVPSVAGREGMESVENQVKAAYNELLPDLTFKATPAFNDSMAQLRDMAKGLPNNLGQSFNENIDQIIAKRMSKNGSMDGIDFKKAESDLSKMAKNYMGSSTASERDLGAAFKQALINFRTALAESNPQKAAELAKTNEAFSKLSILRDAATKANTQDTFSPAQLAAAVRAADQSAGRNKTATGKAVMQDLSDAGVSVLPSKVNNSGTADRILSSSPLASVIGLGAALPYSGLKLATMDRPEIMQKMAAAIRNKSPYWSGPMVNKALGEKDE